jgi:hypothetical protein
VATPPPAFDPSPATYHKIDDPGVDREPVSQQPIDGDNYQHHSRELDQAKLVGSGFNFMGGHRSSLRGMKNNITDALSGHYFFVCTENISENISP